MSQTNFHGDDEIQQGDVVEDVDYSHASSSSSSSSSSHDLDRGNKIKISFNINDGDEEEEDVCRICRNPGDADNPLRYPCACSGSIKFVHQDCLLQWLSHSNARQCEICKHPFSFSPLYAENAPEKLPLPEIILGMTMKGCRIFKFFLRLCFVLSVWLLIIPFITFWIWRLAFVRSFGEAQRLFLSHISTVVILTDCLHGFLLSASIVFIFVGATSLRDYFRQLRELGRNAVDRGDDGERNGARIGRIPAPVNANFEREGNGENIGPQGIAGAGQMIRRNAENIAARWEMQAARLEAHVEQMFDGLDDADVAEDVPFDELVGMQGPVFHFVENAFTLLASNMIFFGVVIFAPFTLGRIILSYLSWVFPPDSLAAVIPLKESAFALANISMKIEIPAVAINVSAERIGQITELLKVNSSGLSHIANNITSPLQVDVLNGVSSGNSRISDVTTLAVGYMFIFSLLLFYLAVVDLIRYAKGEPLTTGTLHGFTSMSESIPSLIRQFFSAMRHLFTMIKVAFLLVIELGLFPLMCGWWMDMCTLRMFGKSFTQRVEFFFVSPLASSLIHWVAGIAYMLQISIFVSLLRGVLRNGVLYFLRDPADPNYNPFRDLIDDPMHKHARRVLLSVAVYGSLILMLVFLPVRLAMSVAPRIFPLDISVSDPFTEIPADVLLFQIYIPFAVEHFKLRTTIKSLLRNWFTAVGWALGLTNFLLPMPNENADDENDREQEQPGVHPGQNMVVQDHSEDLTANSLADSAADDTDSEQSDLDFVLRIVLLLVLAWITLLICNSSIILVPVSLGRVLFNSLSLGPLTHGIKNNDVYAFIIGSYAIWSGVAGARYSAENIGMRRTSILLTQIWKWFTIVVKSSILLSLWVFVIPVLIGVLFELLVIVPIRVPVDESPVFLLYQDWALGFIFLKIWTRLVMLEGVIPGEDGWKMKFERVREDGFSGLRGVWVLKEIVVPVMTKLLTALCFPYVLARGVVPVLRLPLVVNSAVYRFSWLGCLSFTLVCFCAKRCPTWFGTVHDAIRDDRYLIGRRLHNFRELDYSHHPGHVST